MFSSCLNPCFGTSLRIRLLLVRAIISVMPWLVTGITSRFLAGLLIPRFLFALVFVHTVLWLVLVLPILSRALAEVLRAKSPFGTVSGGQVPEDLPVLWPMEAFPNTLGYSYTLRPSS